MDPLDISRRGLLGVAAGAGVAVSVGREAARARGEPERANVQVEGGSLLEIVTEEEGTLFYEFEVAGRVAKAFDRGGDSAELRNDDVVEGRSGEVTVLGETANGRGDSYRFSGTMVGFEYNDESAPAFTVLLDGEDVTDRVTALDTPDAELDRDLLEIRTEGDGTLFYDILVDGRVTKAFDEGRNSAERSTADRGADDIDRFRDGTWGVLGSVGGGFGDAFYLYGPLLEFEYKTDEYPEFRLFLNGEDATDRLLRRGRVGEDERDGDGDDRQDDDAAEFSPDIRTSCYYVEVDAESYDEVALRMSDGSTQRFTGDYAGETRFGFAGSGSVDDDDELFSEYHGWMRSVVVSDGSESASARTDRGNCLDVTRECAGITMEHPDEVNVDVNLYFADGSAKGLDAREESPVELVSPGRVFERASFLTPDDVVIRNEDESCDPGEYATTFDCTEVTITAEEFGTLPPQFAMARLQFVDGTTQTFGDQFGADDFTAPSTFRGEGEHEGKVIERLQVAADGGDVFFNLVNPDADECEAETPTPTGTETPTESPTETGTETETGTGTGTPTETPTGTETGTETPTGTPTESPTESPTETPTGTETETPTDTPTETPTETPTGTESPTGGGTE